MIPAWSEDPLTALARSVWSAGDAIGIARAFTAGAEEFVGRLGLRAGEDVLDVACGTGNAALAAARAGARVVGADLAGPAVAQARVDAQAARCTIRYDVADAEALPYAAGRFDTTITMFGAMFAYRPERVAAELLRVTRSGGHVAMANWTADSLFGQIHQLQEEAAPPPAGIPSPVEWGREETVGRRLGNRVAALHCARRTVELEFPFPPPAVTELFATCYGPTIAALRQSGPVGGSRLRVGLTELFDGCNVAQAGTTRIVTEYLEVQATAR